MLLAAAGPVAICGKSTVKCMLGGREGGALACAQCWEEDSWQSSEGVTALLLAGGVKGACCSCCAHGQALQGNAHGQRGARGPAAGGALRPRTEGARWVGGASTRGAVSVGMGEKGLTFAPEASSMSRLEAWTRLSPSDGSGGVRCAGGTSGDAWKVVAARRKSSI
jgi:hypothetical protein